MNSDNFHSPEVVAERERDSERSRQHEIDDEDEDDEFIEVSILDGLSIEELPPPTTLFREEGDELIEVSIFGSNPEDEIPFTTTRDEELNFKRKIKEEVKEEVREEESISLPVLPNPPPINSRENDNPSPPFSFKREIKTEYEEEEKTRPEEGGDLFENPLEIISPKFEDEEGISQKNNRFVPPPPHEEDHESDEEDSVRKRKPTRRKMKKRPQWTSSQFPSEKDDEGEYYCADCKRGNDVRKCRNCERNCWRWYEGDECDDKRYHCKDDKCFKSKRKRRLNSQKTRWTQDEFPSEKDALGDFFCADCERGNDVHKCRNCGRTCWKWCDGEECQEEEGYKESVHHKCFKSKKKRKKSRRWKSSDFPEEKDGKCYCGDCKSSNETLICSECGRECWKWCQKCSEYRPRKHSPCNGKKKRKRNKTRKGSRIEKLEPSQKKRRLE